MSRTVIFAKVNRRAPSTTTFGYRPFREDMITLAAAHNTEARLGDKLWIAADLTLDATGSFMTGVLGYEEEDELRNFENDAYSWKKGETTEATGAATQNLVPFAVDLRDGNRWVAFATSFKIRHAAFVEGFSAALNHAVGELGLFPSEWEVDLVTSKATIEEWLHEHPDVYSFTRVVRFTNPGRDFSEVRQAMRSLAARTAREKYDAASNSSLNLLGNPEFEERIEGVGTGDVQVEMEARTGPDNRFSSRDKPDRGRIDDFEGDLDRGTELVLAELQAYVTGARDTTGV